ncbi:MAG: hypothetical protein EOO77_23415, partial [Oxalobacteraceae bacterium]
MRHWTVPFLVCGIMIAPATVVAQVPAVEASPAEAAVTRPAIMRLDMPGGNKPSEYQVEDISISVSRTLDGRGDMRGDVTLTLSGLRPLDTAMLHWARQGEPG